MNTSITSEADGNSQGQSGDLHLNLPSGTGEQLPVTPTSQRPAGESGEQYYTYVQEDGTNEGLYSEAAPFQMSSSMPAQGGTGQIAGQPPASTGRGPFPLVRVLLLAILIIIIVFVGIVIISAQASPAMPAQVTQPKRTTQPAGNTAMPTPNPTAATPTGPGTWIPQQLPAGWTNAGLTTGDALFAERTAATFTDREMSIDFRSVGTRANHAGTMTAATFLLTPAALTRFQQNDVRAINNVFFDQVAQEKLVQSVVNAQPQLMQFTTQGQQQFAWVDVTFSLWQSKTVNGQPSTGLETDPGTSQPRIHHMMVLLLRVPQTANAPMGGTGWMTSIYALDLPAGQTLAIVQPA